MSKRMKVLVTVLVAVVLLTVGGAATVMADDGATSSSNTTSTNSLLARVADKLGVTEEELANAFREARQEMREGAFIRSLDRAVEKGCLTEPEANEIKGWWGERPEVLDLGLFRCTLGASGLRGRHMWGGHRGWHRMRPPKLAD